MVKCPLCLRFVAHFHKKSHITPEWMNKECLENSKFALKVYPYTNKVYKRQTGSYASIICIQCEEKSSRFDRYASLVLTKKSINSSEFKKIQTKIVGFSHNGSLLELWMGLNFKMLQNFAFITVLRAHYQLRNVGINLLSKAHHNNIKSLYLNDNLIDDQSFPLILDKSPEVDTFKNILFNPIMLNYSGYPRIVFRGAGFTFFIGIPTTHIDYSVFDSRLKADGTTLIKVDRFENSGEFKMSSKDFAKNMFDYKHKMISRI